jgi:KipI family sensor histidine kinase inhibitor
MRFAPFGERALRFAFDDAFERALVAAYTDPIAGRRALLTALRDTDDVVDAVVTERHAMVVLRADVGVTEDCVRAIDSAVERVLASATGPTFETTPRTHVFTVRYDGPDLDELASTLRIPRDALIERHASARYTVSMLGFLPGFAYLRGLDPSLVVPRRSSPRGRIDAGSVAIAGEYAGIYPFASPGGWHLLGKVIGVSLFDPQHGARLALGDFVHFTPAVEEAP